MTVDGTVSNLAGTGEKGYDITAPTAFTNASFHSLAASPDANLIFAVDSTKGALYSLNLTSKIITPLLYGSTARSSSVVMVDVFTTAASSTTSSRSSAVASLEFSVVPYFY